MLKQVMLAWMEHHNLAKIQANMQRFFRFKTAKQVVDAWRALKTEHGESRRNRMAIRRALRRRPELAKPLFVVRNQLLYKVFSLFKLGVASRIRGARLKA